MSGPAKISGEQYIQVLLERQAAWMTQHGHGAKYPPLLEWFIREEDTALVDLDATG